MNEAGAKRFKRQVLSVMQDAHTTLDNGWFTGNELLLKLGHGTPGELGRAIQDLIGAGLAEHDGKAMKFRSRGVTAQLGIERETAMAEQQCKRRHEDPATAAAHRAEHRRSEALKFARDTITHGTPGEVVAAAQTYEAYLGGQEEAGPDADTAAELLTILQDAAAAVGLLDDHETHLRILRGVEIATKIAEDAAGTE